MYLTNLRESSLQKKSTPILIGRIEKIDLPDLSLFNLDAKIDTGAYTSSLHCHKIKLVDREGVKKVRFYVLDPAHPEFANQPHECNVHKVKNVKSSNGIIQERVIIKQKTMFYGKKRTIELSLTDRSEMKYPLLIGRKFLTGRFVVDVSKKYVTKSG